MTWKRWLLGLIGATINGFASGGVNLLTGLANNADTGAIEWNKLLTGCLIMAILGALLYLKEHREVWTPEERAQYLNGGAK